MCLHHGYHCAGHRKKKKLKYCPTVKPLFSKCGIRRLFLIWKYFKNVNGEKNYSKMEMYLLFLQYFLMSCYVDCDKNSYTGKKIHGGKG